MLAIKALYASLALSFTVTSTNLIDLPGPHTHLSAATMTAHLVINASGDNDVAGGKGADAAIDAIGGKISAQLVKALRKKGKYLLYGALAAPEPLEVGAECTVAHQPFSQQ